MLETPYYLGESLNGTNGLDINEERKIVEDKLKELKSDNNANDKSIKLAMKDLGMQRYLFGYTLICDFVLFFLSVIKMFYLHIEKCG